MIDSLLQAHIVRLNNSKRNTILMSRIDLYITEADRQYLNKTYNERILFENVHTGQIKVPSLQPAVLQSVSCIAACRTGARFDNNKTYLLQLLDLKKVITSHDGLFSIYQIF